jgi:hypothetical protein
MIVQVFLNNKVTKFWIIMTFFLEKVNFKIKNFVYSFHHFVSIHFALQIEYLKSNKKQKQWILF